MSDESEIETVVVEICATLDRMQLDARTVLIVLSSIMASTLVLAADDYKDACAGVDALTSDVRDMVREYMLDKGHLQ